MILKKANATLSLLTLLGMLIHVGYNVFAYLTFYYDPMLNKLTAYPFLICVCLHAVLGMIIVFTQGDGSGITYYPKQNITTLIQRISATLILILLPMHIKMFDLMSYASGNKNLLLWGLLIIGEILFFAAVISHISVSFSKALITMGWLDSLKVKKRIDHIAYVLGAVIFAVSLYAVIKGQVVMFLLTGD